MAFGISSAGTEEGSDGPSRGLDVQLRPIEDQHQDSNEGQAEANRRAQRGAAEQLHQEEDPQKKARQEQRRSGEKRWCTQQVSNTHTFACACYVSAALFPICHERIVEVAHTCRAYWVTRASNPSKRASVLNDETEAHRSARLLEHQGTFIFRHAVFSVLITRGEYR